VEQPLGCALVTDLEQPAAVVPAVAGNDPLDLLDEAPLTGAEAGYVAAPGGEHPARLPLRLGRVHRLVGGAAAVGCSALNRVFSIKAT
jgi:hypothetical protein